MVYRAHDQSSQRPVAVKVLHQADQDAQRSRFAREAKALSGTLVGLCHPGVVQFLDYGVADSGVPFLVMEWLDGHGLDIALRTAALGEADALVLGQKVCGALAALHGCGIVHRDLKPSNLFLVGGNIDSVKIIDFGLVRLSSASTTLTRSGMFLGTPGFVAPEQAQGLPTVDARADLYSLGAVLFAALTQRPPFVGESLMSVLARLLLKPAPRVRELCRDVSPRLDDLIARLLAKDPGERPDSAAAVAAELAAAGLSAGRGARETRETRESMTRTASTPISDAEQRYVSVLLIGRLQGEHGPLDRARIEPLITGADAQLEMLDPSTVMAVFAGESSPTALVAQAAQCALAIHRAHADVPIVLSTGRSVMLASQPAGDVIDRAIDLLLTLRGSTTLDMTVDDTDCTAPTIAPGGDAAASVTAETMSLGLAALPMRQAPMHPGRTRAEIILDSLSARLLEGRMRTAPLDTISHVLVSEELAAEHLAGKLGGKTDVRLVGRDRELAALGAMVAESVDEQTTRVALLKGPAGVGKSRLLHDLLRHIRETGPDACVLAAQADPLRSDAAFDVIAQLVRAAIEIGPDTPPAQQQARIRQRLAARASLSGLGGGDSERITAFMAALIGAAAGCAYAPLRAAQTNPELMRDQMRQAWRDWLDIEARAQPVVLVIEDLHWGDAPSIHFVDTVLRDLHDRPVVIVATARPELDERFPTLWPAHSVDQIAIKPLPRRAALDLARAHMPEASDERIADVVERAGGNPFYLREFARAAASGELGSTVPDTVLAVVGARLDARSAQERRILRAASVFGREFWPTGVGALVGQASDAVMAALENLAAAGMVRPARSSRFADHEAYEFHHALIRDAAYATLTADDRAAAHFAAGRWLERAGERDPLIIAEHHGRGDAPERAVPWYRQAGERYFAQSALAEAYRCYERALELCSDAGEDTWSISLAMGEIALERGLLEPAELAFAGTLASAGAGAAPGAAPGARDTGTQRLFMARALWGLSVARQQAARWQEAVDLARRGLDLVGDSDVIVAARLHGVLGWVLGYVQGESEPGLQHSEQAVALLEPTAYRAELASAYSRLGANYMRAGRWREQLLCNRRNLEIGEELGSLSLQAKAHVNLGVNLHCLGELDESLAHSRAALELYERMASTQRLGLVHNNMALVLIDRGDLDDGERALADALRIAEQSSIGYYVGETLQTRARLAVKRGLLAQARDHAERAYQHSLAHGGTIEQGISLRILGGIGSHMGEHAEAMEILDRAARLLEPRDLGELARLHAERARARLRSGDLERAREEREAARRELLRLGASLDLAHLDDLDWI